MRVLLVSHRYPPDGVAGVERYTQALASGLVKAGDVVSVAARRPAPTPPMPQTSTERLADGTSVYLFVGGDARRDRFLMYQDHLERLFKGVSICSSWS